MPRSRLVLAAVVLAGSVAAPASAAPGVAILHGHAPVPAPIAEPVARAVADTTMLAAANQADLSYPWSSGNVVIAPVTTPRGAALVASLVTTAPVRAVTVRRSYAALTALQQALTAPLGAVPEAIAVGVDAASNRVVAEASSVTPAIVRALRPYGAAVALRVVPGAHRYRTQSRDTDLSPYSGGARINVPGGSQCTTAFPWQLTNTTYSMLTAGHCVSNGGYVYTPASSTSPLGYVPSGTGENWTVGTGTSTSGALAYHGDIAKIDVTSGKSTQPRIWIQGSATNAVVEMATRISTVGDVECTAGSFSSEQCGFTTYQTRVTVFTDEGKALYGSRASRATGACTQPGDSGGPVYAKVNQTAIARGIFNSVASCNDIAFTDIWDAWAGFGGFVQMNAVSKGATLGSVRALEPPHYLVSPDGRFVARMQLDGNFVLYKPGNIPVWSTGTAATANRGSMLEMQVDGNLVLYKPGGTNGHTAIWSSHTNGYSGAYLTLQNDCNLVIYQGGIARWASNTYLCA